MEKPREGHSKRLKSLNKAREKAYICQGWGISSSTRWLDQSVKCIVKEIRVEKQVEARSRQTLNVNLRDLQTLGWWF